MQLVTKTLEKVFEKFPLYSQDGKPINEKKVLCKYFTPWGANTWIVTEASRNEEKPGDWDFFGVVTLGYGWEWGYFSLSELQGIRGQFGLGVERERYSIDPGKKTVYEVLKAEGNGGAEFAEEMLEWSRKEEAEPETETTQDAPEVQPEAEPEEVQPETQDAKQPEPLPDPWPVPENLESLKYNTDDALKLFKDNSYKMPDVSRRAMEDARKRGFYTDLERFSELAKIFIKGVQDKDPTPVLYTYYWLENCGDHNAAAAFLGGGAAEYIDLTPPKEPDPGSLESYEYSAEAAAEIVKKDYGKFHALADEIGEQNTKFRNWGRDCDDLERLAKLFIKGVQENDPQRVLYAYYTLEDINYHQVNRDFLAGKAANYIHDKPQPAQPEKQDLNHIIGQFFYAEQEYNFPRRSVHKDNIKITDVDAEKVHYKIVDKKLNEWSKLGAPLGCGFMSIESFISGLAAGTIYAIKPAAPVIRLATSSAAPFAVLVDD